MKSAVNKNSDGLLVREYKVTRIADSIQIDWRESENLSHGLRTKYPMHEHLIRRLLDEAGYKEVTH